MTVSGARNDTLMDNTYADNNAWGTLFVPFPDSDAGPPAFAPLREGRRPPSYLATASMTPRVTPLSTTPIGGTGPTAIPPTVTSARSPCFGVKARTASVETTHRTGSPRPISNRPNPLPVAGPPPRPPTPEASCSPRSSATPDSPVSSGSPVRVPTIRCRRPRRR